MFVRLLVTVVCGAAWLGVVTGIGGGPMVFVAGLITLATLFAWAGIADD